MQYIVLLAMALFFGFAFEQFYGQEPEHTPGGVRVFPLLSFAGAALYLIEPRYGIAFVAGLFAVGAWAAIVLRSRLAHNGRQEGVLMAPVCTLLAYGLGAVALTQPTWFTVGLTVVAVLLIGSRARLHAITESVPVQEVLTLGEFLLVVGVVLPLLYKLPAIPFTTITPFKVWLAVVAVSTISYASYLLDRYVFEHRGTILSGVLGGMYSSTATTIVFARSARQSGYGRELAAGTLVATAVMYIRLLVITSIFNVALGRLLLPVLGGLFIAAMIITALMWRVAPGSPSRQEFPQNPLALGTALVFALFLIVFSQLSTWAAGHLGTRGLVGLAAVIGFTEIDPFVISMAQSQTIALTAAAAAIVIAASSNNVLKGILAVVVSRRRESAVPVAGLAALAALGVLAAWIILR
jgi:uncharacterized membrane protein (DUF4010 family)